MQKAQKILIAPDSFKGSISAEEAAAAIARGLAKNPLLDAPELHTVPIADGGEGTLTALVPPERQITVSVHGTNGQIVEASYGYIGDTAIVEMARAAGLTLTPEAERFVPDATTFGVGELIRDALDRGFRDLLLTVGGSGTNDGGCGMLAALGADFVTADGTVFIPTGGSLEKIAHIDTQKLDARLKDCRITIATDVKNPLLGPEGATYVYAKQKGCDDSWLPKMERGMTSYAEVLKKLCKKDVASVPGCGAGGGISAPLLAFCGATIRSGIEAVLEAVRFDALLQGATAVITGEGKIDRQSLYGKAISGVANAAKRVNVPVFCLVGCIGDDKAELLKMGIADILATADIAPDAAYSMAHADELLEKLAAKLDFGK